MRPKHLRCENEPGVTSFAFLFPSPPHFLTFTVTSSNILKSKSLGLLNFYVYYVEDDLEINIFRSYQFRNVFRFENTAF